MSEEEEPEYEVESIVEAKVEKANASRKPKHTKLVWKYRVRWKGYRPEDDTWEPIDSFVGSENIVTSFWDRVNTNGRDTSDPSQFKLGESFRPVGPPRPKTKRKSTVNSEAITHASSVSEIGARSSEKRRHISPALDESSSRPPKRLREDLVQPLPSQSPDKSTLKRTYTTSSFTGQANQYKQMKSRRPPSPEVIPDSDEEMTISTSLMNYLSPGHGLQTTEPRTADKKTSERKSPITASDKRSMTASPSEPDPLFDEEVPSKVPSHRAREANPRVKMVDDPNLTSLQGAIAVKARAAGQINAASSSSKVQSLSTGERRSKPGPGRSSTGLLNQQKNFSSLLTFEKGSLKIIKGKYKKDVHGQPGARASSPIVVDEDTSSDTMTNIPPSGGELLELAGLDTKVAETLPDFEDLVGENKPEPYLDGSSSNHVVQITSNGNKDVSTLRSSVDLAKHNLFPMKTPVNASETISTNTWKQSTIFGPLSLGFETITKKDQPESSRLFLNLDYSVSVPVLLLAAPHSESSHFSFQMGINGTPGKFYRTEAALNLLGTVRAGGASSLVSVDEEATHEEKEHFTRFSARLHGGDLFVAVAGIQIFVFCSSSNTLLSQRLNAPPSLLNAPDAILVSQVVVENFSGYADATVEADDTQWTQYIKAM